MGKQGKVYIGYTGGKVGEVVMENFIGQIIENYTIGNCLVKMIGSYEESRKAGELSRSSVTTDDVVIVMCL